MSKRINNTGFTLIEIVSVISVLALIALITIPLISRSMKDSKEGAIIVQINEIKNAAKDYVLKNIGGYTINGVYTMNLSSLKQSGLIDINIKNPSTGKRLNDSMPIEITVSTNSYSVKVGNCESDCLIDVEDDGNVEGESDGSDDRRPIIVLEGSAVDYIEVDATNGYNYVPSDCKIRNGSSESGCSIKYSADSGSTWSDENLIDAKIISNYFLEYNYRDVETGKDAIPVIKKVIVRDTIKPVIYIPVGTTLYYSKSGNNYYWVESDINIILNLGVYFTDNSFKGIKGIEESNPNLVKTGSCSFLMSECYITYKYTDSSGNSRTKVRKIIVREQQ